MSSRARELEIFTEKVPFSWPRRAQTVFRRAQIGGRRAQKGAGCAQVKTYIFYKYIILLYKIFLKGYWARWAHWARGFFLSRVRAGFPLVHCLYGRKGACPACPACPACDFGGLARAQRFRPACPACPLFAVRSWFRDVLGIHAVVFVPFQAERPGPSFLWPSVFIFFGGAGETVSKAVSYE